MTKHFCLPDVIAVTLTCGPHKTMGEVVQNTMRHTRPVVIPRLCGMKQQSIPTPSRLNASYLSKVLVLWNWSYFSFKAGSHVWCNSKHKKKNVWTRMTQAWACLRLMLVSYMTLPPSTCGLRDLQDYMCKAHLKTKKTSVTKDKTVYEEAFITHWSSYIIYSLIDNKVFSIYKFMLWLSLGDPLVAKMKLECQYNTKKTLNYMYKKHQILFVWMLINISLLRLWW